MRPLPGTKPVQHSVKFDGSAPWMSALSEAGVKAAEKFAARQANLEELFQTNLDLVLELQDRAKRELFRGFGPNSAKDPTWSSFDHKLSKSLEGLAKTISQMVQVQAKLNALSKSRASKLSQAEQIQQVIEFVLALPTSYRAEVLAAISGAK